MSGDTLLAPAPGADAADGTVRAGVVWVYRRKPNDRWAPVTAIEEVTPASDNLFGIPVSVSGDTAAIGSLSGVRGRDAGGPDQ